MDKDKFYKLVKDAHNGMKMKESREDEEFVEKAVQFIKEKGLGIAGMTGDESGGMGMKM